VALGGGGVMCNGTSAPAITNCTFGTNGAFGGGGLYCLETAVPDVTNCIFENNSAKAVFEATTDADPTVTACLFHNNPQGDYFDENATVYTGASQVNGIPDGLATGNVDGDPLFRMGATGVWTAPPTYDVLTNETTLTDASASFVPGALVGTLINPNTAQSQHALIVANDGQTITVKGDVLANVSQDDAYVVVDYHLKDGSSAIDAGTASGAPADDSDGESRPFNGVHDIGSDEFVDTDADGLSDYEEALLGTDSNDPDSDDDGLTDGEEVDTYSTDPNDADSDDDGFSDGEEILGSTDPNDSGSYPGVWVSFAYSGTEIGSIDEPFNTLAEGVAAVSPGQIIKIKGDSGDPDTTETPRITKAMHIKAVGGPVRIGVP
jgi:hypothetical protein